MNLVKESPKLSASLEDYLEAIHNVVEEKQAVRAKDIARRLKVRAASVTGALRLLAERGLINYAPYDVITLTAEGERIARDVVRRHKALKSFFLKILGVSETEAEEGACKLEHAISPKILQRLTMLADFVEACPRAGMQWLDDFRTYCRCGKIGEGCRDCIRDCLETFERKNRP
jgi:DtxR family transcriptional regulator, Mn-dependent transcriptional regulator